MKKKVPLPFVTTVRMPEAFRNDLSTRAAQNRRSLNSEIVCLLEAALQNDKGAAGTAIPPRRELAETVEGNSNG